MIIPHRFNPIFTETPERISVTPAKNKRLQWLANLFLRGLEKLGCQQIRQQRIYERVQFDATDLMRLAANHLRDLRREVGPGEYYLVVGYDQFEKINHAANQIGMYPMAFSLPASISAPPMFLGMKVLIIPWIDGCFIIPKRLIDELK